MMSAIHLDKFTKEFNYSSMTRISGSNHLFCISPSRFRLCSSCQNIQSNHLKCNFFFLKKGSILTYAGKYVQQKQGSDWGNLPQYLLQLSISCSPSCLHVPKLTSLLPKDLLQPKQMDYCALAQEHLGGEHKLLHPAGQASYTLKDQPNTNYKY